MAVDSKLLAAFDSGNLKTTPTQQKASKAKPADKSGGTETTAEDEALLNSFDAGNVQVQSVSAAPPATTMTSAATGYPAEDSHAELKSATDVVNRYIGLGTGLGKIMPVDIPPVSQEELDIAKGHIKQERDAGITYLKDDIAKNESTLKGRLERSFGISLTKEKLEEQALSPSGDKKYLQQYTEHRLSDYDNKIKTTQAEAEQALIDSYQTGTKNPDYEIKVAELNKLKEDKNKLQNAVFGIASQHVVAEQVKKGNIRPDGDYIWSAVPVEMGLEMEKLTGNGKYAERIEKAMASGKPLSPDDKANLERKGYQAMDFAKYAAIADDDETLAATLSQKTKGWQKTVQDNNPEWVKNQIREVIANDVYEKAQNTGYSLTGYMADNADLKEAQKKYGFTDKQMDGIKPEDIKRVSNPFAQFAMGAVIKPVSQLVEFGDRRISGASNEELDDRYPNEWWNHTKLGQSAGGEKPSVASLFTAKEKVQGEPGENQFLTVDNPEYEKNSVNFNPSLGNIVNTISEGAGQMYGLGKGSRFAGNAFRTGNIIKNVERADAVGLMAYTGITTWDDNYKAATQDIGDKPEDESKRLAVTTLRSGIEGLTELILPDYKITDKILSSKAFKQDIIDVIKEKGVGAITKDGYRNALMAAFKQVKPTAIGVSKESLEELAGTYANMGVDMVFLPEKYKATSYNTEAMQQGLAAGISALLPIGAGNIIQERQQGKMYKNAMYMAGSNPAAVFESIDKEVAEGKLSEQEAKDKKEVVNTISHIVKTVPDVAPATGKELTAEQKVDYAASRLSSSILEKQAEAAKDDPVLTKELESVITEKQAEQAEILKNAGLQAPVEVGKKGGIVFESSLDNRPSGGSNFGIKFNEEESAQKTDPSSAIASELLDFADEEEITNLDAESNTVTNAQDGNTTVPVNGSNQNDTGSGRAQEETAALGTSAIGTGPGDNSGIPAAEVSATEQSGNTPVGTGENAGRADVVSPSSDNIDVQRTQESGGPGGRNGAISEPANTATSSQELDRGGSVMGNAVGEQSANVESSTGGTESTLPNASEQVSTDNVPAQAETGTGNTELGQRTESEQVESNKVGDNIKQRFAEAPKKEGNTATRTLASGETMSGTYMLVPANSVTPSHNPQSFQSSEGYPMLESGKNPNDRDYTLPNNIAAVTDRAGNYNGAAVDNTPTVDKNGVVIDGNDRTMSGQLAAQNGTDAAYLQSLKDNAPQYGFTAQEVEDMIMDGQSPRLVFVPDVIRPYETSTYALFNKETSKPKSAFEKAVQIKRTVPEATIDTVSNVLDRHETMGDFYKPTNIGDQRQVFDALMEAKIIEPSQATAYFNPKAGFNAEGKALIENVMLSQVLDEDSLALVNNEEYVGLRGRLIKGVKHVLAVDSKGNYGVAETVNSAVQLYNSVNVQREAVNKGAGKNVSMQDALDDYLRTIPLFPDDVTETTAVSDVFSLLVDSRVTQFGKEMKAMAQQASPANSGFDLFGNKPKSKTDLIIEARQIAKKEYEQEQIRQAERLVPGIGVAGSVGEQRQDIQEDTASAESQQQENETGTDVNAEPVSENNVDLPSPVIPKPLLPINSRIEDGIKDVAKYEALVEKRAVELDDMRRKGQANSDQYKVTHKFYQKNVQLLAEAQKELKTAQREYQKVSDSLVKSKAKKESDAKRTEKAKKTADKVRSAATIKKRSNDGRVYAADPLTATVLLGKIVGRTAWNASVELVAQAIEKGTSLRIAIENGVSYLRDKARGSEQIVPDADYDVYRDMLGANTQEARDAASGETQAQYNERLFRQKNIDSANKLSDRQFKQAEDVIASIQKGTMTLSDAVEGIKTGKRASKELKGKVIDHITKAIQGDPNKFLYDDVAKKEFDEDVKALVAKKMNYTDIVGRLGRAKGRDLTFAEKQNVVDHIKNYKLIGDLLSDSSPLDKKQMRGVVKAVAESAYLNDDTVLKEALNHIDSHYEVQSHKDLEEYAKAIVDEFGAEKADQMAQQQAMAPANRQVLMAYVADAYKRDNNEKALQGILNRIATDATAYGQGVEATKIVYQVLGLVGAKGVNEYVQRMVEKVQETVLAAHAEEAAAYKKQIADLQKYIAEQSKSDKKMAAKVGGLLTSATKKATETKAKAASSRSKMGKGVSGAIAKAQGGLNTPAEVDAMRKEIERAVRNAYPLLDKAELDDMVADALGKFNDHVKELNEGNLYEFYRDVMFPKQGDGDNRDTKIAERLISVVNSAIIANGAVDQLTLDAIKQEYGIEFESGGFIRSLNDLVANANEDALGVRPGQPSVLKDNIADLVRLNSINRTAKDAAIATGLNLQQVAMQPEAVRMQAIEDAKKFVMDRYASLGLTNTADAQAIADKVADRYTAVMDAHRQNKSESVLANYYMGVMQGPLPTQVKTDRDTRVADKIIGLVNASADVNGPGKVDQLTLDALQQEHGLTFVTPTFVDAVNDLVAAAGNDVNNTGKGTPTKLKDDIAQLVRLYSVDNAIDQSLATLAEKLPEIVTRLASVRDGITSGVVDYVQKEFGKLGIDQAQAQEVVDAVKGRYGELLRENANKYLGTHLGSKEGKGKKADENHSSFYTKLVQELSALELSDPSFKSLFAEKYDLRTLTDNDYKTLRAYAEEIEKWHEVAPKSQEYGAAIEKFFNIINEKSPEYLTNLANGLRSAKVLGAIWFTVRTARSNASQTYTRGITEFIRSVKDGRTDVNILKLTFRNIQRLFTKEKMDGMASTAFKNIFKGATPVSNIYEQELATRDKGVLTRLEEFVSQDDSWRIRASKWIIRNASRTQNAIDSWGQLIVQEQVQYSRISEMVAKEMKAQNPNVKSKDIVMRTKELFDLTNQQQAVDKARAQYNEMGVQVDENSPRFKYRVAEIRREHRDAESLDFARRQARIDFWKETDRTAGSTSAGIGGLQEKLLTGIRDVGRPLAQKYGPKALTRYDATAFLLVGFVGGTTRFNESKYENIIFYSLAKAGALQIAKNKALTESDREMIARKQLDVIVKGVVGIIPTTMALATYYLLKSLIGGSGDDDKDKSKWGIFGSGDLVDPTRINNYKQLPKKGFLVDGYKFAFSLMVAEQEAFWLNLYANVEDYANTDSEKISTAQFLAAAWNTSPESMLSSGTIGALLSAYALPTERMTPKLKEIMYDKIGAYVAGFVPWYQRIATEGFQMLDQRQLEKIEYTLPYDKSASNLEKLSKTIINTASRAVYATSEALGINNWVSIAGKLKKPVLDPRGREINAGLQYDSFTAVPVMFDGNASKYDALDDILSKAGAKWDYYSRDGDKQMLFLDKNNKEYIGEDSDGKPTQIYEDRQRGMTDDEFHEFRTAISTMNGLQLKDKESEWRNSDAKTINSELNDIQHNSYDYAKKGIESGLTSAQIIEAFEKGEEIVLPPAPGSNASW